MGHVRTSSIEDQFVDAVRSALDTESEWSSGQLTVLSRRPEGDLETAEFTDSSYMSRATYNLKARDLRITLRNCQLLRIAPVPVEYWRELLDAPSAFFLDFIRPRLNVERLGWFKRVCGQFKSRRRMLEAEQDWSSGQLTVLTRTPGSDVEKAEFVDSSYMSRATYNLKASDLRITLRNGRLLRIAPIPVEYWDELLGAPSKGAFLDFIRPRFNVERLGWFKRVCG